MPVEGRDLSSRQTQQVMRDLEIGQPINSEQCSEVADGVTRKSEGRSRVSLLRPVRQDQPRRHPVPCLCPVPFQQGRTGYRRAGFRGCRSIRVGAVAWRTGACAQAGDLPTGPYQTCVYPEGQRQTQAAGHLDLAGSGLHDSSDAGAGTDLRSRSAARTVRLPAWAKCPTGGVIAADANTVSFRYKDYRNDGPARYKVMTLATGEFIRRFLMHVLPKGFHRIRHYGLFAKPSRADNIARARQLLAVSQAHDESVGG